METLICVAIEWFSMQNNSLSTLTMLNIYIFYNHFLVISENRNWHRPIEINWVLVRMRNSHYDFSGTTWQKIIHSTYITLEGKEVRKQMWENESHGNKIVYIDLYNK